MHGMVLSLLTAKPRVKSGLTRAPWQPDEKSVNRGLTKNLEKMPRSAKIKPLRSQVFFLGLCDFGGVEHFVPICPLWQRLVLS